MQNSPIYVVSTMPQEVLRVLGSPSSLSSEKIQARLDPEIVLGVLFTNGIVVPRRGK
jgi:hypothetical protein